MIRSAPTRLLRSRRARLAAASSAAVIVWSIAGAASALPSGGVVYDPTGSGLGTTITPGSGTLTVDQGGERVVIDWSTFNIGTGESVTFNQPDANAIAFNRVDPSAFTSIDGTLAANGGVWLFSPGGLLFGANAQVNVGSFVGSTAQLQDADIAAALSGNTVSLSPLAVRNGSSLTVTAGADLTATNGFMVLQGETIVQNGNVVSNTDAVWYGVAEGGQITFAPGAGANGPSLTDGTVTSTSGSQPSFTQGSTGVTTAATWVGASTPGTVASGWSTVINLGGAISASGVQSGGPGVVIITGNDGVVDLTHADVTVDSSDGTITSTGGDVYIAAPDMVLGDIDSSGFIVTEGSGVTTVEGTLTTADGYDIIMNSSGGIVISLGGVLDSGNDIILTSDTAAGDFNIQGDLYAAYDVVIAGDGGATVTGDIDAGYSVTIDVAGAVDMAGSSDVTATGAIYVSSDAGVTLAGEMDGAQIYVQADGDIHQTGGTLTFGSGGLYFSAGNNITTDAGALIQASASADHAIVYLDAFNNLYVGGDIHGDYFVNLLSQGAGANPGLLEVTGTIYASDFIELYSDRGDIHVGATAELYTGSPIEFTEPSIFIAAEGSISTDAGSYIHTPGGYPGAYVEIESNDVVGSIDLGGDISSTGVSIHSNFGSVDVTVGGSVVATDYITVSGTNDVTIDGSLSAGGVASVTADGDLTLSSSGSIDAAYAALQITNAGSDYLMGIYGDITAVNTISLENRTGDIVIGSNADLHANSDASPDNGGPLGYQTYTIEIVGQDITLQDGSRITVGDAGDPYRGAVYIHSDGTYATGQTQVTLSGYIQAESLGVAIDDGSLDISGSIYAKGDLAFDVTGYFTGFAGGSGIHTDGYVAISADSGVDFDGDVHAGGDISVTTTGTDADIELGGDLYANGQIQVNATGDITLVAGGSLQADADTSNYDGYIGLYAQGSVTTETATSLIVGNSGNATGDVVITAQGDDTNGAPIDISSTIYAEGLGLVGPYGSIHIGGGDIHLEDSLSVNTGYDFLMDYGATIHSGGYVDITAQGELSVGGSIYATGDINLYRYGAATEDLTVGGFLHSDSAISIVNAGDGDVIVNGDVIADADGDTTPGSITISSQGQVRGQGGLLQVGSGVYNITGDVNISAQGPDGAYDAIDLAMDINAHALTLDGPYGSIHLGDGVITLQTALQIDTPGRFTSDDGSVINANGVNIRAAGDLTVDGDIYSTNYLYLYRGGADVADVTVSGHLESYNLIGIYNGGPGDVDLSGARIIANADGLYGGAINIVSQGSVTADSGLLQVGPSNNAFQGNVSIAAYGDDPVGGSAVDLAMDIYAYGLTIDAPNGSIRLGGGIIRSVTAPSLTAAYDLAIEGDTDLYSQDDLYLTAYGDISIGQDATVASADDVSITTTGPGGSVDIDGHVLGDAVLVSATGDITIGATGDVVSRTGGVSLSSDSGTTDATTIQIDGYVYGDDYVYIDNATGSVVLGDGAEVRSSGFSYDYGVRITTYGDLDVQYGAAIYAYNDILLRTTDVDGDLTVDGYVYGGNVFVHGYGDISVGGTIIAYYGLEIESDSPVNAAADIVIDGVLQAQDGISIANRNDGDVVFGANANVATYYNYGEQCVECYGGGLRTDGSSAFSGGQTALLGMDGDIYIYSANQVVTAAGSVIDATGSVGTDAGLVVIRANGVDGPTTSAVDLSGDIVSYETYLYATNGSIHLAGGTITVSDGFYASADAAFVQDAGSDIDGNSTGSSDINIYAGGDIGLGGSMEGYYVHIETSGAGSSIDISGYVYATDQIEIYNYGAGGGVNLTSTGEVYVGDPNENSQPEIRIRADGAITSDAGSFIHTYADDTGGYILLRSESDSGNAMDLAGDISTSGDVRLWVNGYGTLQITDGVITAGDRVYVSSYGQVHITGGTIDAGVNGHVYFNAEDDMLLGGSVYAGSIAAHIYGGEAAYTPGAAITVDGHLEASDYVGIYNDVGEVALGSNADIYSNTRGTVNQGGAAVRIEGVSVTSDAGSLIETPAGNASSEVLIQAMGATGTTVDLQGDIDAGIVVINTGVDGGVTIGGDITAQGDIIVTSAGLLTVEDTSTLRADDLVALYADRNLLIQGDIYGRYIRANIYGGEGGSGIDGAYIRVEGNLYADQTIELYNGVGDVEIGAGAQVVGNLGGYDYQTYQGHFVEITGENITTEAGSLITVGADGGPREGDVYLHAYNYYGDPTLMDLSGDIDTYGVIFQADNGSMHVREGTTTAIDSILITVDGYLTVETDGAFVTDGLFSAVSNGGMTFDGDVTADGIRLTDLSGGVLEIGGDLYSEEEIYVHGDGDVRLGAGANLVADRDNYSNSDDFHYVTIDADGQVSSAAGSSIRVGDAGASTGDVTINSHGYDGGGYASIDLSGDIEAQHLYLNSDNGSIRLRDGDITVSEDLDIDAAMNFVMDGQATVYTAGDFNAQAVYGLSVAGRITALGDIDLTRTGAVEGGVTVNGYLYAGYNISIVNQGPGDIVLGGPTLIADYDGDSVEASVLISAADGQVQAPGGGTIRVGLEGEEHGAVTIYSGGADTPAGAAIDLSGISITAGAVNLTAADGSIDLDSSTGLYATGAVNLDAEGMVTTGDKSVIQSDGDVGIIADGGMDLAGTITAGDDIGLTVPAGAPPGQTGFTAQPGDIVVSGVMTADGGVQISNYGGDVYISGQIQSDADGDSGTYGGQGIRINGNGQIITGADSVLQAGPIGSPSTYVSIFNFGDDTANYSSIDLSGDIEAQSLFLTAGDSVHLRDGDIDITDSIFIGAYGYVLIDAPATLTSGGDVNIVSAEGIQSFGDIGADGYIYFHLDPDAVFAGFVANAGDIVVGGDVTAGGSIIVVNEGLGDIYIDGTAALQADADGVGLYDHILIDSLGQVISADGSTMVVGEVGATTGAVHIYASGGDNATYSSVDLSGDIDADSLLINADGSIHLRDGDITVAGDLFLGTYVDFLMDAPATIDAGGDVDIVAVRSIVSLGDIDSGGDVYFHLDPDAYFADAFTAGPGDLVVGGAVTADGSVDIVNEGSGDIYLDGTAAIVADADSTGGPDHITIESEGQVISAAGSSMLVGQSGATTGDVSIYAYGADNASYSSIDLSGDIEANGLNLYADGSIHLADGDILLTDDLFIGTYVDFLMDAPATITTDGDVTVTAVRSIVSLGQIDSGGDIYLHLDPGAIFEGGFSAGPGDLVVGGSVSADGSVDILNEGSGDIYVDGTAAILADADSAGGPDHIAITSGGQIISASGSSMVVGAAGATTGDVILTAAGGDNPNYSALDLSGDIDADTLTLDADNGSIHLADGTITVAEDLDITNSFHIVMDAPAAIDGAGDVSMTAGQSLQVNGTIYSAGDIDLVLNGPAAQDLTIGGDLTADGSISADNAGSGLLTVFEDGSLDAGSFIYLTANGDIAVDGAATAAGNVLVYTNSDIDVGGSIFAGSGVTLQADDDIHMSGDITSVQGAIRAEAGGSLYQYAGSIDGGSDVFLLATFDMVVDGEVSANDDVTMILYGGEGGTGNIDINGDVAAGDDIFIENRAEDVNLGSDASLQADADGDGGADVHLSIYAQDQIYAAAGSTMHVGDDEGRTGFITLYAEGFDGPTTSAIDLSGDIDAGSITVTAYNGSVQVREGSIAADNDVEIYAGEFFILGEDGVISGAEDRNDDGFDKPTGVLVYAGYDSGPGVSIVASDVDIEGQITSGDAIAIIAYNVSGGDVTVGGADPANLGTGFTLSNAEFQNLSADTIIIAAGQGAGYSEGGYDLHVADLNIDPENVDDVWLGTQEDIFVEGTVTPNGEGVDLHLGFALLATDEGDLAENEFLIGFVPNNIFISGSLGSVENPFGSVTLVAQGDILMGSSDFMDAALEDPEFNALEQSDAFDSPGEGHIFIASDVLQMATPGRILQQNTGTDLDYGGLAIGLPQPGQELIFVPDQIDGEAFGNGSPLDFSNGATRIELFGYLYGENGQIVDGFDAAQVDNLLDPDLLVGAYYINNCQFYGECAHDEDIPIFHDPFPPVQLDPEDVLSFFSGFPFAEPDDEDDEDQIQGEPVTGSGNEDLWTMKPTGVRP